MTDTGQVPGGEGLPENAGAVDQPGVAAPGAYTYLDPADATGEEDELLLMPGSQGAWGQQAADHSQGQGQPYAQAQPQPQAQPQSQPRRPLHLGPAVPDTHGSPVRSLADRGPAQMPARQSGPPTTGPEYLDIPPQGAAPWQPARATQPTTGAETVAPQYADQHAQVATPPHGQEFAQVGAYAYGTQEQGECAQQQAQSDYVAHAYADQTLGQFVPVEGVVPTTPHLAPTPPQAMTVPPLPEDQLPVGEGAADPQGVVPPQAVGGEAGAAGQHAGAEPQEVAAQAVAEEQDAAARYDAADHQGAVGDEAGAGAAEQYAAADQPGGIDQQGAAEQFAAADQQAVAGQQNVVGQQSVTDQNGAVAHQPGSEQQAFPGGPVVTDEQSAPGPAIPAQQGTGEQPVADQQVAPGEQAAAGPQAVPGEQDVADQYGADAAGQPVAGQQPATDGQGVAGAEVPVGQDAAEQPVADQPVVDQQMADQQVAAGEQEAAGPQVALGQQDPAGHPAAPGQPVAAEQTVADPQQPVAGEQAPAEQAAEPGAAEQPQVVADAVEQAPAGQAPADQAAALEQQPLAAAPLGADAPQPAPAQPEAAGWPATTDGRTDATGEHAVTVPTAPADPNAAPAQQQPEGNEPVAATDTPVDEAATVPAPRESDSGAVPLTEAEPAEQTLAPAELTGEPEHLAPEPADATHPAAGAAAPAYDDAEREAVLRVMRERRDIRNGFRSDPIPHEVLLRVLEAAHTAPSVGHSQPWDFVVIRSADTRRAMHELAMRQKDAYAKSLPKGRAKQFKELKIEAILDTPVNIVVTADPTRGGRHTLGRHTQPQMAPYSSALAVENLWLAARAEGLGVGWVSFFDEREMVRSLGLPEHLEVVAYLCVGYVDEFPEEPELMQAGWSKRRPLSWVVHEETYGRRALPGEDPHDLLAETVSNIRPLDAKALGEAWERQKRMTKPAGALGMLEIISAQLSGLSRVCPPPIPEPAAVAIFAGDHGVHAQGVTPWPQEVTGQMVANFLGGGAVCNAFANQVGAEVCVIDVGVASELPSTPGLLPRKVRAGTADMTTGPALTREEVKEAIEVGIETARDLVAAGNKALLTGEMGIANTTASAALISVYTEVDPAEVTGRGTGINDETHARKVEVVRRALDVHKPDPADPIGVLSAVGGLEHAAMVGLLLGGASLRTPVILDGVSAGAAALVARAIAPEVLAACIAGHRSAEPGHVAALNKLGLRPLVDLDLRLGEGTGALLALPIVQSAARAMHEVATFDSAGVTEK
ncbi:nicotinate-nucleotide--dimethylbenzimidazole phosphoribosyltransferase [Streptomyces sp. WG-D5]